LAYPARKIYDQIVKEKTAKGYTPGIDGTPYQHTDKEQRSTGVLPQLLNAIEEAEAEKLLSDAKWWATGEVRRPAGADPPRRWRDHRHQPAGTGDRPAPADRQLSAAAPAAMSRRAGHQVTQVGRLMI
jgi:hypothetical protein